MLILVSRKEPEDYEPTDISTFLPPSSTQQRSDNPQKADQEAIFFARDDIFAQNNESKVVQGYSYALEYQIDLSSYFRLLDNTVDESSQAPINIDNVCEFTLQGSGLDDNKVKVFVSFRAAMKIYEHTNRQSAVLIIKEIQIPSTADSKDAAGLMTSVLSFEPSGVVFSDDTVDGELSNGDYITVSTPTLMTWDANWHLNAYDVSDALRVVWKENEDYDWQACQYGNGLNGIIDISEKKADTRIIATYCIKHFCLFSCFRWMIGLRKQAYALCVMSKNDIKSEIYSIQCIICYEHPKYCRSPSINDDCLIAYQDFSFYGDPLAI